MNTTRIRAWIGLAVAAGSVATATGAFAGHEAAAVPAFTGCISTGGDLRHVAPGDAPAKACGPNDTLVHLSAGDLTGITAGTGLVGGGTQGSVSLGVAPDYRLPQGCASGEVAERSGGGWACGVDGNTTYSGADFALSGQTCPSDLVMTGVDAAGGPVCKGLPVRSIGVPSGVSVNIGNSTGTQPTLQDTVIGQQVDPGTYLIFVQMDVVNSNNQAAQDNARTVRCAVSNGTTMREPFTTSVGGLGDSGSRIQRLSGMFPLNTQGPVEVVCVVINIQAQFVNGPSLVHAEHLRLSLMRIA